MTLHIDLAGTPAADADAPILREHGAPELPDNAVLNADGTVRLTFGRPAVITFRTAAGDAAKSESYEELLLRRLTGADMRKVFAAPSNKGTDMALALSCGLSPAKLALMVDRMDAADLVAARDALSSLLEMGDGLPARAEEQDDGSIRLPLLQDATDGDGTGHSELVFKRLRGGDLVAISTAKERDSLAVGIHRATGITLKAAQGLFDELDAADVVAAQRVISFLSGVGPKTGR